MTYASTRQTGLAVGLAVVVAAFLAYSLPPYLSGGTRVPPTFGLHYPLLVAHVFFGSAALVCALAQIWPGLRRRRPGMHRVTGRAYVGAAAPAALCAMVIGAATPFGPVLAASNVGLGALWLWFTITGFLAARRGQFAVHRRQMIYSATLALSIITNRLWAPVLYLGLEPLRTSVFGGDDERYLWAVAGIGGWLGWTIPMLAVRRWMNRQTPLAASSVSSAPATGRV